VTTAAGLPTWTTPEPTPVLVVRYARDPSGHTSRHVIRSYPSRVEAKAQAHLLNGEAVRLGYANTTSYVVEGDEP
jgi:hypothetical protein